MLNINQPDVELCSYPATPTERLLAYGSDWITSKEHPDRLKFATSSFYENSLDVIYYIKEDAPPDEASTVLLTRHDGDDDDACDDDPR